MTNPLTDPAPLRLTAMGANDLAWAWLDLSQWIPPGDTPSAPVVTVTAIPGDVAPMTIATAATIDTGSRVFRMPGGVNYTSAGPRIMVKLQTAGATVGNDYALVFQWSDTLGQILQRTVHINVANR